MINPNEVSALQREINFYAIARHRNNLKEQIEAIEGGFNMKTKKQHTPTPWMLTLDETEDTLKMYVDACPQTTGYDETVCVAQISHLEVDTEEARANAEFIVRAVNSYEALLKQLKISMEKLKKIQIAINRKEYALAELTANWREEYEAIAQAEGKGE